MNGYVTVIRASECRNTRSIGPFSELRAFFFHFSGFASVSFCAGDGQVMFEWVSGWHR